MTYTIPEAIRNEIEKKINRCAKKAEKYGKAFSADYGKPYAKEIPMYAVDMVTQTQYKKGTTMIEVFDLTIESEVIKQDGYKVVAAIEHLDGGNIVNAFETEINPDWIHSDCYCEHCKTNRIRKHTFIVRDEAGNDLQVGRSCLKDYCGIDPQSIGYWNEINEILLSNDFDHYDYSGKPFEIAFETVDMLALAVRQYRNYGYIKSGEPGANKTELFNLCREEPTEEERAEAARMANVIKAADDNDAIRFLLADIRSLLNNQYCKGSHFGYIAYAPVAFEKYEKELANRAARQEEYEKQMVSQYVGEVGKRQTFEVKDAQFITSWENMYGVTFLYKFIDNAGNVLVWFASSPMESLDIKAIKATVKCHNERDGVKKTVITRCKVA